MHAAERAAGNGTYRVVQRAIPQPSDLETTATLHRAISFVKVMNVGGAGGNRLSISAALGSVLEVTGRLGHDQLCVVRIQTGDLRQKEIGPLSLESRHRITKQGD